MLSNTIVKQFKAIVGQVNFMDSEADRAAYSYDSAVLQPVLPALVVRPETSVALGNVVKLCGDNGLSLTVRGSGTNLSGGTIPSSSNGIVVLTNALNKIVEINEEDMYAIVEPGVITAKFAAAVAAKGLFYPPDPGSQAVSTIGGNVAENAGGLRGLKYGVTKNYVMGVNFFDTEGELIVSGSKTVKCATGLNLTGLMVGSEGILGVLSEITLKLVPPPIANKAMIVFYDDIVKASQTVAAIIAAKIVPCTLEFLDNFTIRTVEDFAHAGLPVNSKALLLIEVDGHPAQVADEFAQVEIICNKMGATKVHVAKNVEERNKIWEARRMALSALARVRPTTILEDATVPRSRIPEMIMALDKIATKYRLLIGIFGHAGDGNLHPTILTDRRDIHEFKRVETAVDELFETALNLGGTLSGEHGIGMAKSKWLVKETSRGTIFYSRRLKKALDPMNILNPGKLLGEE